MTIVVDLIINYSGTYSNITLFTDNLLLLCNAAVDGNHYENTIFVYAQKCF